jgi:NADH-quinone oxidoreductase subunit E
VNWIDKEDKMFKLSKEGLELVKKELTRYETKRSAILPILYIAQRENKWISPDVVQHLAEVTELPITQISEVLSFYTMYNKKPVGKYHIQVCTNIACSMAGGRELAKHLTDKLNVKFDEVTSDARFTISKVECLGSC